MTPLKSWLTPVELAGLGALWGSSFLFMRVSAGDFGAFALVEVRLLLGAFILMPLLWRARASFPLKRWPKIAAISVVSLAIPLSLFAWAAQQAPAGVSAIANATTVMFTALAAFALYGERISKTRILGLVAGFLGVVVLASDKIGSEVTWPATLAGVFASFMYGLGSNFLRKHMSDLPPGATAAATLFCASLLMAPLGLASWPEADIPAKSWICALLLGALCTGTASFFYYRLVFRIGAPRAATVTYLIPLFGVLFAWALLDETPTAKMALAAVLILCGVALSQQRSVPVNTHE